jgi:hypothetical protein
MPSEPLHSAFDALRARLQAELDTQLASLQTTIEARHGEALAEAKRSFAADVEQLWSSKLGSLREEWAAKLRAELAAASTEAARTLAAASIEASRTLGTEVGRLEAEKSAAVAAAASEAARTLTAEVNRLEAEKAALAAASTESARMHTAEISRLDAENAAAIAAAGSGRAPEAVRRVSLHRLAGTLRRISEASSLAHALDALADGAAAEAPFTALFLVATVTSEGGVESATLERWRSGGEEHALPQATMPASGVFADAVRTRQATTTTEAAPAFASPQPGHPGLVVPVVVGEQAVAVLYAEGDANADSSQVWQEAVQILGQHASACLSLLTAARISQALGGGRPASAAAHDDDGSARRYARLLVSEIKLYNESAVRTGRERRDLLVRLRPEIERARRLYEARVPVSVGDRATLFQQELVQTLAEGDPNLLGASA